MKVFFYVFLIAIFSFSACKSDPDKESADSQQSRSIDPDSIPKIDVHAHFKYSRDYLPAFFEKWNMQAVLVDVAKEDSASIGRSWDEYLNLEHQHPDLFYLCSSLIGVGIDSPDFAEKAIEQLSVEIDSGARMVKVWKNFGMVTRDAAGNFIQIDDERLNPIWDFLKSKGIPVMAHIGEPEQAWRELDPGNPHYGYYKNNPQYHAFQNPDIPSYETIIAARDLWIENNPDLRILGAHLGSMSHDVEMVAERLDSYPNLNVELAARFGDLARQDTEKVRNFFTKYQDRILFGSDFGNSVEQGSMSETDLKEEEQDLHSSYNALWQFLSGNDSLEIRNQKTIGLGLPLEVLNKVYYQNAVDFLELGDSEDN